MLPWDYHSAFTSERLVALAQLLSVGRALAVERHDTSIGDDNWTLGVCAYKYCCFQISENAGKSNFEWLEVIDSSHHFQFSIGGVPVRFWRGDPANPSDKIAGPTAYEQLLFDFGPEVVGDGVLYRIGITADLDGGFLGANFVTLRGGQPEAIWPIPYDRSNPLLVIVDGRRPEGRELPAPQVGAPDEVDGFEVESDSDTAVN